MGTGPLSWQYGVIGMRNVDWNITATKMTLQTCAVIIMDSAVMYRERIGEWLIHFHNVAAITQVTKESLWLIDCMKRFK